MQVGDKVIYINGPPVLPAQYEVLTIVDINVRSVYGELAKFEGFEDTGWYILNNYIQVE